MPIRRLTPWLLAALALCWLLAAAPPVRAADDAVDIKPAKPAPAKPVSTSPKAKPKSKPKSASADTPPAAAGSAQPASPVPPAQHAGAEANIAEGGGSASAPAPANPAAGPTPPAVGPMPPPAGGAGTVNTPGPHPNTPNPQGAGNAADSNHSGPTAGNAQGNVAEGGAAPAPGAGVPKDLKSDESMFGPEDLNSLLPGIAQGQPGQVHGAPQQMLEHPGVGEGYESPLGPTKVPLVPVEQRLEQYNANPGKELQTNFGRLVVPTGTITGSTKSKQFHIEGGVTIFYSDVTISGDTADIDEKQEIAVLKGNVTVIDPRYTLSTDEIRIHFEDKQFEAVGSVQFKKLADVNKSQPNLNLPKKQRLREYFAGQQFELYCFNLFYNWSTRQMHAVGSVRLVHPSFGGTMDRVDYDDKTKQYLIDGNVKLNVEKYDWVFANELVDAADADRTKAVTDKPTTISCDRLVYSEDSGLAQFYAKPGGQVVFDQTERTVKGMYMEVNDKTKDFHVEGTLTTPMTYDQTNGDWLYTGGIIKREEASPELQDALSKPLNATALSLTYNFDRRRLEMNGGVKLTAEKKQLQADEIVQDDTSKFFLLRGNVLIQPDNDSTINAAQVFLDTANDVVSFVGLVQGKLMNADLGTPAQSVQPGTAGAPVGGAPVGLSQDTTNLPLGQQTPGVGTPGTRIGSQAKPGYNTQPGGDGSANIAEKR